MRECTSEQNKPSCDCSYGSCNRKGIGCECLAHHSRLGELPACFFPDGVEKTCDRFIERFVETYQKGGGRDRRSKQNR